MLTEKNKKLLENKWMPKLVMGVIEQIIEDYKESFQDFQENNPNKTIEDYTNYFFKKDRNNDYEIVNNFLDNNDNRRWFKEYEFKNEERIITKNTLGKNKHEFTIIDSLGDLIEQEVQIKKNSSSKSNGELKEEIDYSYFDYINDLVQLRMPELEKRIDIEIRIWNSREKINKDKKQDKGMEM